MQQDNKKYGLIKLSKSKPANSFLQKSFVFDDSGSSDSDSETVTQYQSSNLKKQAQIQINKAVENDPSIFQYDEVYDDMKKTQTKEAPKKAEAKPRYISNLLKTAELRKREQEIRLERKIQKEREQEGEEFKDKDAFVTSAYKEKLEEMKKLEEESKQQEKIDDILDVTKQKDLSGFYRSLYKNSMFNDDEEVSETVSEVVKPKDYDGKFKASTKRNVNLRERIIENDDAEESEEDNILKNDSQTELIVQKSPENVKHEKVKEDSKVEDKVINNTVVETSIENPTELKEATETAVTESVDKVEVKPKVDRSELIRKIFTKRTVGEVFVEARNRYLQRKELLNI